MIVVEISGVGVAFAPVCFTEEATATGAGNGFAEHSFFPIEVREAVLTTAAIDVAVIPFEGLSGVDEPSNATSSNVGSFLLAHFS